MLASSANLNQLWSRLIIEELTRHGISQFVISPGSRSTPLTLAAAEHPKATTTIIYDERGAAFFALGYARATAIPAVLICTSGTAAANYFPAVIEAATENVPMLVLSADRPPELRASGANQTIDQVKIFGEYARWFCELPCPDQKIKPGYVLSTISHALQQAYGAEPGPVHVNAMFREPLAPTKRRYPKEYVESLLKWEKSGRPYTSIARSKLTSDIPASLDEILRAPGIILCGKVTRAEAAAVDTLAGQLQWPVFADITCPLRLDQNSENVIRYADQLLLNDTLKKHLEDHTVLQIGGPFVSKRMLQWLEKHEGPIVHVSPFSRRVDPGHGQDMRIKSDIELFCRAVAQSKRRTHKTMHVLKELDGLLENLLQEELSRELSEASVARVVSKHAGDKAIFCASSMPIRDMDMFAAATRNSRLAANRGASGIDGTVASAAGFAAGQDKPLLLLIGDLALFHDLNSLHLLKQLQHPATIVVVNNGGGGIFHFLPVAQQTALFEEFFATPHTLSFKAAAEMFGLDFEVVEDLAALKSLLEDNPKKHRLIEIRTGRGENLETHRRLQQLVAEKLEQWITTQLY